MSFEHPDRFEHRHLGPGAAEIGEMLAVVKAPSLDALVDEVVPPAIRLTRPLSCREPDRVRVPPQIRPSRRATGCARVMGGYYDTITPPVICATSSRIQGGHPVHAYQAEIAQGRWNRCSTPDHGSRPDRHGSGQRVAARRADGGGRINDAAAPRAAEARTSPYYFPGVVPHLAADTRSAPVARRAARSDGARGGPGGGVV